jgi:hypothetical protein
MYTNIPKLEVIKIIESIRENDLEIVKTNKKEIISMLRTIMEQNYFQFDQTHYKQTVGLAMGAPTPEILAEAYLQHREHKQLHPILKKYQISGYFRCVDDILLIYSQNKTNID